MPIHSMTGFGEAQGRVADALVRVTIKAVNHKNLDVRVRTDRSWSWLEPHLLKMCKARLGRGRVDVSVEVERASTHDAPTQVPIDEAALKAVAHRMQVLARESGMSSTLTWRDVLAYRGLFEQTPEVTVVTRDPEACMAIAAQACDAFIQSRRTEGQTIDQMMRDSLKILSGGVDQIATMRPVLMDAYRERLSQRLRDLLEREGVITEDGRIAQEVIVFADRTDIAEEIQRARAHIERLSGLFESAGGPVGKKLDFYLQEMIRETNTMASKSNFSDLTEVVVEMKTTIERMREQAANVE